MYVHIANNNLFCRAQNKKYFRLSFIKRSRYVCMYIFDKINTFCFVLSQSKIDKQKR